LRETIVQTDVKQKGRGVDRVGWPGLQGGPRERVGAAEGDFLGTRHSGGGGGKVGLRDGAARRSKARGGRVNDYR